MRGLIRTLKSGLLLVALSIALPAQADWYFEVDKQSAWQGSLSTRLAAIEEAFGGALGVYVQNLQSGEAFSWQADTPWYLASLIKVPVAAEVLARRQAGDLTLDQRLTLAQSDFVDGAGPVIWHDPGTPISIAYLLEQMITVSDNTATDMLIDRVELAAVNARAAQMVAASGGDPGELGPITTLKGVRRGVYGELHPEARSLAGTDFIELRKHRVSQRPAALARRLGVSPQSLRQPDYESAFDAYQHTGENTATLRAYGDLLASLENAGQGDLDATQRQALIEVMTRTRSGQARLTRGLGESITFAHKTGTQHHRSCDAGLAYSEAAAQTAGPWVIVTCTRGGQPRAAHEQALARVGEALRITGAVGAP
ncbi:serine hydrolase [Halomonas sp. PAMB 3232]|uniref:serine hydrolase n=1 Tax=Halomonas sp. PAMB 3232 TaxID=3075221 RepID=UPI00289A5030|nr:serine hydrolase [Halomonas sp. PAMB 3232]WNL38514.1 serine hydrolase [Halomonas sp. PAMB 3232]